MGYQSVVFAIENRGNPITFDDLRARLLVHEQRLKLMHSSSPSILNLANCPQELAMAAHSSRG